MGASPMKAQEMAVRIVSIRVGYGYVLPRWNETENILNEMAKSQDLETSKRLGVSGHWAVAVKDIGSSKVAKDGVAAGVYQHIVGIQVTVGYATRVNVLCGGRYAAQQT